MDNYRTVQHLPHPLTARERQQRSNEYDFKQLPFFPRFEWEDMRYDYGPSWDAAEILAVNHRAGEALKIQQE